MLLKIVGLEILISFFKIIQYILLFSYYLFFYLQVYCHFKNPETTLEELDMLDADFTLDILALLLIFVVLRIAAYLFLRWKLKTAR